MKLYASFKKLYQADLFSTDDPLNDDAVLTFQERIQFGLQGNFGTTMTLLRAEPVPLRWVLQNFTDPFGNQLFIDQSSISAAWRITSQGPVINDFTGVELYRHNLVRI